MLVGEYAREDCRAGTIPTQTTRNPKQCCRWEIFRAPRACGDASGPIQNQLTSCWCLTMEGNQALDQTWDDIRADIESIDPGRCTGDGGGAKGRQFRRDKGPSGRCGQVSVMLGLVKAFARTRVSRWCIGTRHRSRVSLRCAGWPRKASKSPQNSSYRPLHSHRELEEPKSASCSDQEDHEERGIRHARARERAPAGKWC